MIMHTLLEKFSYYAVKAVGYANTGLKWGRMNGFTSNPDKTKSIAFSKAYRL
uniref:Uncharacterized protein n=1 Tax=Lepeophtheirus salmonis TaxID=72036 RepID=A0A0K2TDK3_LEPSM